MSVNFNNNEGLKQMKERNSRDLWRKKTSGADFQSVKYLWIFDPIGRHLYGAEDEAICRLVSDHD